MPQQRNQPPSLEFDRDTIRQRIEKVKVIFLSERKGRFGVW
jgi:hypothetical protein